jgi:hypothetical protein
LGRHTLAPDIFSEQGAAMLSGVLTSERAIEVNIQIMPFEGKGKATSLYSGFAF